MQKKNILQVIGGLILILAIFFIISYFSSPISVDFFALPTGIIEDDAELYQLILELNSKKDLYGLNGRIILPEGFELADGDLNWNFDLQKNEPIKTDILIKPVSEGEWNIGVIIGMENKKSLVSKELTLNVDPSLKIYMSEEEWIAREKEKLNNPYWIERYYRVCDVDCFVPKPLKGDELNEYFKSLNLKDENIYVMVQFDVLGADPSKNQIEKLEGDGVILLDNAARHTWFAKAPKEFLETKSYDFIRWIGIPSSQGKRISLIREKITNKNCSGTFNARIIFYEGIDEVGVEEIGKVLNTFPSLGSKEMVTILNLDVLDKIASLNFVKEIGVQAKGIPLPKIGKFRDSEVNFLDQIICS